MRLQSDRRKLRINKWVWHGVAMDPSEMCGSERPKWLKSYSWDRHWHLPKNRRSSFSLRRHLNFHNCHVAETASYKKSPSIKKWGPLAEHVVVIALENLVKRCFLMFPDVSWRRLFRIFADTFKVLFSGSAKMLEVERTQLELIGPWLSILGPFGVDDLETWSPPINIYKLYVWNHYGGIKKKNPNHQATKTVYHWLTWGTPGHQTELLGSVWFHICRCISIHLWQLKGYCNRN